jgi:intracellular septation protein
MKAIADFLPVILFFVVYKISGDILAATLAIVIATLVQLGIVWLVTRTLDRMLMVSGALVVGLGGLTMAFGDSRFIQWKPTVLYWLLALVVAGFHFFRDSNLTRKAIMASLGKSGVDASGVPDRLWKELNLGTVAFMAGLGILNLAIAYSFDESTWVNFKLFGLTGLTFLFLIYIFGRLSGKLKEPES